MNNPSGPYPGRQLFLGVTSAKKICFAYLVTGRSPESRQRRATTVENNIRIGPLGNVAYDPLRHYTGVKFDDTAGIVAISNGIQTEAIYETYRLLYNVGTPATADYMKKLLDGANAEPDSLHTPRIAGIALANKGNPELIIGIKTFENPAVAFRLITVAGCLSCISTYMGNMEKPEPTNPANGLPALNFTGDSPDTLAKYIYEISAADYKDEDIRVCAVGGIYSGNEWQLAIKNKY
jgi:IMP cyclohydrolase